MLLIFVIGIAVAFASVFWQSLLQNNIPYNMTGRVFSISSLAGNASLPAAYGIFGVMLAHSSIMKLMLVSGSALIILSSWIMLITFKRKLTLSVQNEIQ